MTFSGSGLRASGGLSGLRAVSTQCLGRAQQCRLAAMCGDDTPRTDIEPENLADC